MTAVVVDPSWVTLTLDTTPPVVKAQALTEVDPPSAWEVLLVADEDVGGASFALVDAYGTSSPIGYESVDDRTLRVVVPSEVISGGPARLDARVWDEVCNAVEVEVRVWVRRDPLFTADLSIGHAYDTWLTLDRAYEVESAIGRVFDVRLEMGDG